MSDFRKYFDTYKYISPTRFDHLEEEKRGFPSYSADFVRANASFPCAEPKLFPELDTLKYKKIYQIMEDECLFRNVPMPRLFLDREGLKGSAFNYPGLYAISLTEKEIEEHTDAELRWTLAHELKHLYQDSMTMNAHEQRENELDADKAATESTNYETGLACMRKVFQWHHEEYKKAQPVRAVWQKVTEGLGFRSLENNVLSGSKAYPSIGRRLKAMREREAEIQQRAIIFEIDD